MGEAIVFTSGKGGVGKTTTIANIGAGLSRLDKTGIDPGQALSESVYDSRSSPLQKDYGL